MALYMDLIAESSVKDQFLTDPSELIRRYDITPEEFNRLTFSVNVLGLKWEAWYRRLRIISSINVVFPITHKILIGTYESLQPYDLFLSSTWYKKRTRLPEYPFPHPVQLQEPFYHFIKELVSGYSPLNDGKYAYLHDVLEYENERFSVSLEASSATATLQTIATATRSAYVPMARFGVYRYDIDLISQTFNRFNTPLPFSDLVSLINPKEETKCIAFKAQSGNLREVKLPPRFASLYLRLNDNAVSFEDLPFLAEASHATTEEIKKLMNGLVQYGLVDIL